MNGDWHLNRFGPLVRFLFYALRFWVVTLVPVPAAAQPASIPFKYGEGLLWIDVQTPRAGRPLHFLFDTGAELSVLDETTVRELHLKTGNPVAVQGVQTTLTGHWPVRLPAKAGDLVLPANYLALNLSELAKSCHRPVDGLLGADFIRGRVVEIDFASRQIRFPNAVVVARSDTVLPIKAIGGGLCVPIHVNGRRLQWVRLDTGCATPLQWVTTDASVRIQSEKPAIGLAAFAIPQAETTVAIGDTDFDRVPTGIHRRAIFPGESGLLGNGLLSRFNTVTIDAKTGQLVLKGFPHGD